MSKVAFTKELLAELIAATSVERGKRDTHEKHLNKIVSAVGALDDDAYDAISDAAAEWYDAAVDALNAGEAVPGADFDPDATEATETKPSRGRSRATKSEETEEPTMKKTLVAIALAEVVKGITVTVVCGDDTFEGDVTAVTKKGRGKAAKVEEFTLTTADGEEVFGAEDLLFDEGDKIERHDEVAEEPAAEEKKTTRGRRGAAKKEEPAAEEKPARGRRGKAAAKAEEKPAEPVETDIAFTDIAEGDQLKLQVEDDAFEGVVAKVTKKGRGKASKVVAFVLKTADGEEEFEADHIVVEEGDKIIKVTVAEAAEEPAAEEKKTTRGRRGAAKKAPVESAASQVRKLICSNLDADKKAIEELIKENGIDMKASTFDVLYSEAHNLISVLRELDMLAE